MARVGSDAVTIYGAESQLRHPRQFLRASRRGFRASLHIAPRLTLRGLRSQYRNSLLGYFWIIGPSIGVTGVWLYLDHAGVVNGGETHIPYGVYVLVGTLLWMSFGEALNAPITHLTNSSSLLSNVSFPAESLQLAGMLTVLLNAIARLLLVFPVFVFSGVRPGATLLLFPVGLLALLGLGFAVGLALAPLGALYRDVGQSMTIALAFLFLVTPVAYKPTAGSRIGSLNPITPMLNAPRDWLTGGPAHPGSGWFAILAVELVLLVVSWLVFRLAVPHLVDRISS